MQILLLLNMCTTSTHVSKEEGWITTLFLILTQTFYSTAMVAMDAISKLKQDVTQVFPIRSVLKEILKNVSFQLQGKGFQVNIRKKLLNIMIGFTYANPHWNLLTYYMNPANCTLFSEPWLNELWLNDIWYAAISNRFDPS